MRTLLAVGGAAVVGLWAMTASADQVTGTISKIDLVRNTFVVDGTYFTAAPNHEPKTLLTFSDPSQSIGPGGSIARNRTAGASVLAILW